MKTLKIHFNDDYDLESFTQWLIDGGEQSFQEYLAFNEGETFTFSYVDSYDSEHTILVASNCDYDGE